MNGRRMVAAGVVAAAVTTGAVAGAVLGIPGISSATSSPKVSTAATSNSTPTTGRSGHRFRGFGGPSIGIGGQGVLAAAAKALNLSTPDLLKKLSDGKTTIADVAQQEGIDLSKVTDAMEAVSNAAIQNLVNQPFPSFPNFKGKAPQMGPGQGPAAPGIFGFGFGFGQLRGSIDSLAKSLGISTKDLMTDLGKGQSIADIAKSKNVDINTIIDSLVADATSKINSAVSAKHLSSAQATKIEANLKDEITKLVNGSFKFGGFGGKGGKMGHGFGHFGGFPGGPAGATPTMPSTPPAPSA